MKRWLRKTGGQMRNGTVSKAPTWVVQQHRSIVMLTSWSSRHRKPTCIRCATPWRSGSQVRLIPSPKTPHCECSTVITPIHGPQSHSPWKLRCFYDMSKVNGSWNWFFEDVVGAGDLIWQWRLPRWPKHGILKLPMAVNKAASSAKHVEG